MNLNREVYDYNFNVPRKEADNRYAEEKLSLG